MKYKVMYSDEALKAYKKLDKQTAEIIYGWIGKNLVGCENPRQYGKPLGYERKGEWRYRVGAYRIIAEIRDDIITIEIINAGHRRNIYH